MNVTSRHKYALNRGHIGWGELRVVVTYPKERPFRALAGDIAAIVRQESPEWVALFLGGSVSRLQGEVEGWAVVKLLEPSGPVGPRQVCWQLALAGRWTQEGFRGRLFAHFTWLQRSFIAMAYRQETIKVLRRTTDRAQALALTLSPERAPRLAQWVLRKQGLEVSHEAASRLVDRRPGGWNILGHLVVGRRVGSLARRPHLKRMVFAGQGEAFWVVNQEALRIPEDMRPQLEKRAQQSAENLESEVLLELLVL